MGFKLHGMNVTWEKDVWKTNWRNQAKKATRRATQFLSKSTEFDRWLIWFSMHPFYGLVERIIIASDPSECTWWEKSLSVSGSCSPHTVKQMWILCPRRWPRWEKKRQNGEKWINIDSYSGIHWDLIINWLFTTLVLTTGRPSGNDESTKYLLHTWWRTGHESEVGWFTLTLW